MCVETPFICVREEFQCIESVNERESNRERERKKTVRELFDGMHWLVLEHKIDPS